MFNILYKKSKPGVKGVFTRQEKINCLNHEARLRERRGIIGEEKLKARAESNSRQNIFRSVRAQLQHPASKVKMDKSGNFFIQERLKGKFQSRQTLNF